MVPVSSLLVRSDHWSLLEEVHRNGEEAHLEAEEQVGAHSDVEEVGTRDGKEQGGTRGAVAAGEPAAEGVPGSCTVAARPDLPDLRAAHVRHTAWVGVGRFDPADRQGLPRVPWHSVHRVQKLERKRLGTRPGGRGTAD